MATSILDRPTAPPANSAAKPKAKKGKSTETPRQKFEKVGALRVSRAIKSIRLIGSVSGVGYEYSADDVTAIRAALNDAVEQTLLRFAPGRKAVATEFTFAKPPTQN